MVQALDMQRLMHCFDLGADVVYLKVVLRTKCAHLQVAGCNARGGGAVSVEMQT
jgi:hypothetical protein